MTAGAGSTLEMPLPFNINGGIEAGEASIYKVIDAALVTAGLRVPFCGARKILVHVKNTHTSAHEVTAYAGSGAGAAYGDYVSMDVVATNGERLIVLESQRFQQSSGELWMDFGTGMTGFVAVFLLP